MNRERLTITLADAILRKIDSIIDNQTIRNRSHAIEYALGRFFLPRATKVVVLAGGAGVHMRPLTYEMPKALVPVHGEPLLGHTVRALEAAGLEDMTMVIGTLGKKIREHFGDGASYSVQTAYVEDKKENGTAQALAAVRGKVGAEPFLLVYGDVLADIDWMDFIHFHHAHGGLATMAVTNVREPKTWGVVAMDGTRVTRFVEKPNGGATKSHLINAGLYVMHPDVLAMITPRMRSLEEELFPTLAAKGELHGYHFSGKWFDVSTPAVYERALKEWRAR